MTTSATRLLALLGRPVAHSRSPLLWTRFFHTQNIDASYVACAVEEASLGAAVEGLRALGALGANVTVPHKQSVLAYAQHIAPSVAAIGAANVLLFRSDGVHAHNTDAPGMLAVLRSMQCEPEGARVVVLGAGGSAAAVACVAAMNGAAHVAIVARNIGAAEELCVRVRTFGCTAEAVAWERAAVENFLRVCDAVVQCTPLGMHGHERPSEDFLSWLALVPARAVAIDLVYGNAPTVWNEAAIARGLRSVDGKALLCWQAAFAANLWFGTDPVEAVNLFRRFFDPALGDE